LFARSWRYRRWLGYETRQKKRVHGQHSCFLLIKISEIKSTVGGYLATWRICRVLHTLISVVYTEGTSDQRMHSRSVPSARCARKYSLFLINNSLFILGHLATLMRLFLYFSFAFAIYAQLHLSVLTSLPPPSFLPQVSPSRRGLEQSNSLTQYTFISFLQPHKWIYRTRPVCK